MIYLKAGNLSKEDTPSYCSFEPPPPPPPPPLPLPLPPLVLFFLLLLLLQMMNFSQGMFLHVNPLAPKVDFSEHGV